MSAQIHVEPIEDGVFEVRVVEGPAQSSHRVTVKLPYLARLTSEKIDTAEILRRAFEFLLAHEPKESILARFDLQDIQRYFPNFESVMKKQLSRRSDADAGN